MYIILCISQDPCEESSSEEPSLADELPPQPPPRTDSLTRSMIESQLTHELQDGNGTDTAPEDDDEDFEEDSRGSKATSVPRNEFGFHITQNNVLRKKFESRPLLHDISLSNKGIMLYFHTVADFPFKSSNCSLRFTN